MDIKGSAAAKGNCTTNAGEVTFLGRVGQRQAPRAGPAWVFSAHLAEGFRSIVRQVEQQIITAYHRRQVLIDLRHHLQKARQISERLSEAATKAITQHESFEPISSNMQEQFKADADLLARNLEPIKKQSWPPECSQDQIRALDSTTLANLDLANLHSASNAASYCTDLVIAILKLEQQIDDLLKDNRLLSAGVIQSPLLKEIGGIQEPCDQSKAGSYASHVAARIQLRPAAAMTLQKFNHPYQVLQMLG